MGPVRKSSLKMVLYHKPSREKNYRLFSNILVKATIFWDLSIFVGVKANKAYVGYVISLH